MTRELTLEVVLRRRYTPLLSETERLAYQAAHRIVSLDLQQRQLPCPGGKRSRAVDLIAREIMDTFAELENARRS